MFANEITWTTCLFLLGLNDESIFSIALSFMFRVLWLSMSGRCCYLGCSSFSAIIPIAIKMSWMKLFLIREKFFHQFLEQLSLFGTIFRTVLYWTHLYRHVRHIYFSMDPCFIFLTWQNRTFIICGRSLGIIFESYRIFQTIIYVREFCFVTSMFELLWRNYNRIISSVSCY